MPYLSSTHRGLIKRFPATTVLWLPDILEAMPDSLLRRGRLPPSTLSLTDLAAHQAAPSQAGYPAAEDDGRTADDRAAGRTLIAAPV